MSGGSKRAIPEAAPQGVAGWPVQTISGVMPGQMGLLSNQLSEGFGTPPQVILAELNRTYTPMQVHVPPTQAAPKKKAASKPSQAKSDDSRGGSAPFGLNMRDWSTYR